ncbi:MAG: hypothetical protein QOJ93_1875 [Actinomycetota bacterium]|nr:hypothetical protein [Actinomycetota bacterium]
MRHRVLLLPTVILAVAALGTAPAGACGGLVAPNGTVRLLRTTTLAGWHAGVEHYVTSFRFAGDGDGAGPNEFGSIVPLPAIPTSVVRGGDWTLQRLEKEVEPPVVRGLAGGVAAAGATAAPPEIILQTKIDSLDITVLKGGGQSVGEWAKQHGFLLTPDAPEILDWYAKQSPVFMAARFDAAGARQRGQQVGDGIPVHITMPLVHPWVPLRILTLGRGEFEPIDADVFLLTDTAPIMQLPPGTTIQRSEPASTSLLTDLRTDKGMEWVPPSMWLTFVQVGASASTVTRDLSVRWPSPPATTAALDAVHTSRNERFPVAAAFAGLGLLALASAGGWRVVRRRPRSE